MVHQGLSKFRDDGVNSLLVHQKVSFAISEFNGASQTINTACFSTGVSCNKLVHLFLHDWTSDVLNVVGDFVFNEMLYSSVASSTSDRVTRISRSIA